LLLSWSLLLIVTGQIHHPEAPVPLERVICDEAARSFMVQGTGRKFQVWGLNYDRDARGRLIEDYWRDEWPKVEADFRAMKKLGANVVRVHLQFGRFVTKPDEVDRVQLEQLKRLIDLAERLELYLDLTGLGCYSKADIPAWYDALPEAERWRSPARFWEAVSQVAAISKAVFCYDLMNEPVVPAERQADRDWLGTGPGLDGKFYVQKITLDPAGRARPEVARAWIKVMRVAIRRHDPNGLITVGLLDASLDEPGAPFVGITPQVVAAELDFVAVHLYPEPGKIDQDLARLKRFRIGAKPLIIEETFPLKCGGAEFARFADSARDSTAGLIGFYWGEDRNELKRRGTIAADQTSEWLEYFERNHPTHFGNP
jgi:hypothetical protein